MGITPPEGRFLSTLENQILDQTQDWQKRNPLSLMTLNPATEKGQISIDRLRRQSIMNQSGLAKSGCPLDQSQSAGRLGVRTLTGIMSLMNPVLQILENLLPWQKRDRLFLGQTGR